MRLTTKSLATLSLLASLVFSASAQDRFIIHAHRGHFDATMTKDGRTVRLSEFATLKAARDYAAQQGVPVTESGAVRPVYYCNALTKKGTRCKHRVQKDGDRCWQHKNQPAK